MDEVSIIVCPASPVFQTLVISALSCSQRNGKHQRCTVTCMNGSFRDQGAFLQSKLGHVFHYRENVIFNYWLFFNSSFSSYKTPFFALYQLLGAGIFHKKVIFPTLDNFSSQLYLSLLEIKISFES